MTIYFVGIGGAGLSPMAQLAQDCGYWVTGSDRTSSLGTQAVEARGVFVDYLQDGRYLQNLHREKRVDWVVHTAACLPDHPELEYARKAGIRVSKRDEFINHVAEVKNLKIIGIAGTHGKTTTTSMCNWVLTKLGIPHAHLVGSTLSFGPAARYQEKAEYLFIEADEFDRNFLHFHPSSSVITNIDFDHPDIYASPTDYFQAFAQYIHQNKSSVWLWQEDWLRVKPFLKSENHLALDLSNAEIQTQIQNIKLFGFHNRTNAYLAFKLLQSLYDLDPELIYATLATFPGAKRRMEQIIPGLWSDYAHHPVEVRASLQMAKETCREVVVIYQPHQNLRQHEIMALYGGYRDAFDSAYTVYWLPTYLSREDPGLEILTPQNLVAAIPTNSHIRLIESVFDLESEIARHLRAGRMVLAMGAGSIDGAIRKLARSLEAKKPLKVA